MSHCLACGVEKDMEKEEVYPYPEDSLITDEPIQPLCELECQTDEGDFRIVIVCHQCFHKLQPDMWISQGMWEALNPITPTKDLPKVPNDH